MNNLEYQQYILTECERQWNENQKEVYGEWSIQADDTKSEYYNEIYKDKEDLLNTIL